MTCKIYDPISFDRKENVLIWTNDDAHYKGDKTLCPVFGPGYADEISVEYLVLNY